MTEKRKMEDDAKRKKRRGRKRIWIKTCIMMERIRKKVKRREQGCKKGRNVKKGRAGEDDEGTI